MNTNNNKDKDDLYKEVNALYEQLDELETLMKTNPTDEQLQQWNVLKALIAKEYEVIDAIRLERHNWEVRTGYKVATIIRGFDKNSIRYVVCDKDTPSFTYVCATQQGNLIEYVDSTEDDLLLADSKFHGWGATEDEAIVAAFEYIED